jgi:hypothetical protein
MNARLPAAVVLILALVAFFVAFWFGARGASGRETRPSAGGAPALSRPGAVAGPREDAAAVKALEAEVAGLAARVADAESKAPHPRTAEEKAARGREIASLILQSYDELDGDAERKWRSAFLDLTPEMAPAFAAAFWEQQGGSSLLGELLAAFTLQSGGPAAGEFVEQVLRKGDEERVSLLRDALFGVSEFYLPDAYPAFSVTDAVAALALADVSSPSLDRRLVGIMLLRWRNTAESRAALQLAAESDAEPAVRQRALIVLGIVGDSGTIEWLERYTATFTGVDGSAGEALRKIRERLAAAAPPKK